MSVDVNWHFSAYCVQNIGTYKYTKNTHADSKSQNFNYCTTNIDKIKFYKIN